MLATLMVNSLLDNTPVGDGLVTLREAMAAANANTATDLGHVGSGADTIQFSAALVGTINLSTIGNSVEGPSSLNVTSPITIRGNANGITLNAAAGPTAMRHFYVSAGGTLTLETINVTGGVVRGIAGADGQDGGDGRGGGVYSEGVVNVIASTFYNNRAIGGLPGAGGIQGAGRGGAIYSAPGGTVTVRNATFSGNSALNSSETSVNSAYGGSIYNFNGHVEIYNTTMTGGAAFSGKAVYVIAIGGAASAHSESSIMATGGPTELNYDFTALQEFGSDTLLITGSGNLIRRALNFNDAWDVDPLLGPLVNHGGPTLTHALQPLSPAIDSGSNTLNLTTDQRGATFSRVVAGAADIGAFEQQAAPPALVGDFNRDAFVDAADYVMWRKTMDMNVEVFSGADANGNALVDDGDLSYWTPNFGETSGGAGGEVGVEEFDVAAVAPAANKFDLSLVSLLTSPNSLLKLRGDILQKQQPPRTFAFLEPNSSRDAAMLAALASLEERNGSDILQGLPNGCHAPAPSTAELAMDSIADDPVSIRRTWRWI
jgi:hypothetical protein